MGECLGWCGAVRIHGKGCLYHTCLGRHLVGAPAKNPNRSTNNETGMWMRLTVTVMYAGCCSRAACMLVDPSVLPTAPCLDAVVGGLLAVMLMAHRSPRLANLLQCFTHSVSSNCSSTAPSSTFKSSLSIQLCSIPFLTSHAPKHFHVQQHVQRQSTQPKSSSHSQSPVHAPPLSYDARTSAFSPFLLLQYSGPPPSPSPSLSIHYHHHLLLLLLLRTRILTSHRPSSLR
ncbi:hypothetical protein HDK90DRAFT_5555 [Phyllosticta capitalensis]|uniref:Uncharacterized protein n=2 Tax=Phyllosticta capitalensis TaxID=121624 RepID=A0ABR1Z1J2_9PEZI